MSRQTSKGLAGVRALRTRQKEELSWGYACIGKGVVCHGTSQVTLELKGEVLECHREILSLGQAGCACTKSQLRRRKWAGEGRPSLGVQQAITNGTRGACEICKHRTQ